MNKQQWEDLAAFAGVVVAFADGARPFTSATARFRDSRPWNPDSDWTDFGPLWMRLDNWVAVNSAVFCVDAVIFTRYQAMREYLRRNNTEFFMRAGCELGAAIGAAMRRPEESKEKHDHCGACGQWVFGPIECCHKCDDVPHVTKTRGMEIAAERQAAMRQQEEVKGE